MEFLSTMTLCHIIGLSACAPLWKIAHKNVKNLSTKKEGYHACVSYLNLIQNKAFKDKIDRCMSHQFDEKISASLKKTLNQDNIHFIDLIVFYKNTKSLILNVLVVVVYCLIKKYV